MRILSRLCTSLDGFVTGTYGLPIQLGFPDWDGSRLGHVVSRSAP